MANNNDEREFRLRPRKPRAPSSRNDGVASMPAFKMLMHYARQSRSGRASKCSGSKPGRPHRQRCAVRITYSKNATRGQWRAHGRYLERESAGDGELGFNAGETGAEISTALQHWQAERDKLLWKFIISPEFGDRVDLQRLTRDLLQRMEQDLDRPLEWIAVVHRNTEHPHVHVALRGAVRDRQELRLSRDYVKQGIREIAEDLCTRQLGFRTSLDAVEAQRREVQEPRLTSLDRIISRNCRRSEVGLVFVQRTEEDATLRTAITNRLFYLQRMESARSLGHGSWLIREDTEQLLRAAQRTKDRQRTLAAHGELVSDARLRIEAIDWKKIESVEGRVLVHGQDEQTGKSYLMLEATNAILYYVPYTQAIDDVRSQGGLRANSFIRLRKLFANGQMGVEIKDFGNADAILSDRQHLREKVEHLASLGDTPQEDGWSGWLGKFQSAVCAEAEMLAEKHRGRLATRRNSMER